MKQQTLDTEISESENIQDLNMERENRLSDFHCRQYELDRYQSASGDYSVFRKI